jgi:hypothetical protein
MAARADRKKLTVLAVLGVLLVASGIRAVVLSGPRAARASAMPTENPAPGVSGGSAAATSTVGEQRTRRGPETRVPAPPPLMRDLFALSERHFPKPSQTEPVDDSPPKSETAKVETPPQVPAPTPAETAEARVRKEVERLRLRGTLLGGNPTAVIEIGTGRERRGTVVRPGEDVLGFKLVEVRATEVVLEKDGIRIELKRALPES